MNTLKPQHYFSSLIISLLAAFSSAMLDLLLKLPLLEWYIYLPATTLTGTLSFFLVACLFLAYIAKIKPRISVILVMASVSSFIKALISHATLRRNSSAILPGFSFFALAVGIIIYALCMLVFFDLSKAKTDLAPLEIPLVKRLDISWLLGFSITTIFFIIITVLIASSMSFFI